MPVMVRELRSMFYSPLAWSVMAVAQLTLGWVLMVRIEEFLTLEPRLIALEGAPGVTDLVAAPLFDTTSLLIMLLSPLLSMRTFADEYRQGTISLLLSAPISCSRLVLGKFIALWIVLLIPVGLAVITVLSLRAGTVLDYGKLAAGALGLLMLAAMFGGLGLFASSLTENPAVAAVISYGTILLLWNLQGKGQGGLAWLSPATHLRSLLDGLLRSADLTYFISVTLALLLFAMRRIEERRRFG